MRKGDGCEGGGGCKWIRVFPVKLLEPAQWDHHRLVCTAYEWGLSFSNIHTHTHIKYLGHWDDGVSYVCSVLFPCFFEPGVRFLFP